MLQTEQRDHRSLQPNPSQEWQMQVASLAIGVMLLLAQPLAWPSSGFGLSLKGYPMSLAQRWRTACVQASLPVALNEQAHFHASACESSCTSNGSALCYDRRRCRWPWGSGRQTGRRLGRRAVASAPASACPPRPPRRRAETTSPGGTRSKEQNVTSAGRHTASVVHMCEFSGSQETWPLGERSEWQNFGVNKLDAAQPASTVTDRIQRDCQTSSAA